MSIRAKRSDPSSDLVGRPSSSLIRLSLIHIYQRQGGKQTGLLIGKRLNQHALHRTDGRIFYNSRLPTEPINLSVGLLIDESGSMCSNDRITRARATAIVIQDFCESLDKDFPSLFGQSIQCPINNLLYFLCKNLIGLEIFQSCLLYTSRCV